MNYSIVFTSDFEKAMKKLGKRYKSLKDDFKEFLVSLQSNPNQGTDLGNGLRKIRFKITSKGKEKVEERE